MWVVIHVCTEAMLGISLYSYFYPKLAKMLCLSYYILCFLFHKIREEGRTGSAWKWGWGRGWAMVGGVVRGGATNNVYTHKQM
jgi:hypothetical protein